MNFATLNRAKAASKKKEFDVKEYLDQRSKLSYQVDLFFVNEPIALLDSAEAFDSVNDFKVIELETSLSEIVKQYC